ncbi:phiSA1p31-related protein [Streptomyces wuyuanensis]|uniref:Uncharacterized protein n=1 Tax=Streptomyces wuyuanensis TaxID=1196353 RepID=A0A1G9VVS3_9ACTN|nr:phiSA1p31-related protein [Streptomyces wuyuanensis]SDM76270.1 hypothetical protein SAMN05444921_1139 [Streptomyces wuyuanensis]
MSITLPTNIPSGDRRTIRVVGIEPAPVVYVDRDGDEWHPTDETTPDGEPVLACPAPQNPDDQGEGRSHPWTLRAVQAWFGPLTTRSAVSS